MPDPNFDELPDLVEVKVEEPKVEPKVEETKVEVKPEESPSKPADVKVDIQEEG